jgi:hypothetical protein
LGQVLTTDLFRIEIVENLLSQAALPESVVTSLVVDAGFAGSKGFQLVGLLKAAQQGCHGLFYMMPFSVGHLNQGRLE